MSRGPSVTETHPEALNPSALWGSVTLAITAPGMLGATVAGGRFDLRGASTQATVEGTETPRSVRVTDSLADALGAPDAELVVLRGLYQALTRPERDPTAVIDALLARTGGAVLVVRPRALSWLLDHGTLAPDPAQIARVDTVVCLRYRRYRDLPAATDAAERAAGRPLSDPDALSTLTCPGFEIAAGGITLEAPATLAPGWAGDLSLSPDARWLTARDVALALGDEGAMTAGSLGPAVAPFADRLAESRLPPGVHGEAGRVALALVACLRATGRDPAAVTRSLRALTVTPAACRRLEATWNVPPDTLASVASLATRSAGDLGLADDTVVADAVQSRGDVLETFAEALADLGTHARPLADLRRLATATAGVDSVARDVRAGRRRLTRSGPRDLGAAQFVGPEPDRIRDASAEGGVVVLTGPPGAGKTTAALAACRRLRAEGATTAVPLFGSADAGVIERAVERSPASVVVASFGGRTEYGFDDPDRLWRLLGWLDRGLCETVVLETRTSHQDVLAGVVEDAAAGGVDTAPWHDRTVIDVGGDGRVPDVARAALTALGADTDRREQVATLAGNRPDTAWLAAGHAAAGDRSLSGFEDGRHLARTDCSPEQLDPAAADLVAVLAALGVAPTEGLRSVLGAHSLRVAGRAAGESLGGGVVDALRTGASLSGVAWTVRPGLVADTVFRAHILQAGDAVPPAAGRFGDLLDRLAETGTERYYLALAWRLVTEYAVARRRGDADYQRRVRRAVDLLMTRLTGTGATRFLVVEAVVLGDLPVDPERIGQASDAIVAGSAAKAHRRDGAVPEWAAAERLLGALVATTVDRPGEALLALLGDVATEFERTGLRQRGAFVAGVYAAAITRLASREPDPEAVRAPLRATLQSLRATASSVAGGDGSEVVATALGDALTRTVPLRTPETSPWPDIVLDAATGMLGPATLSTTTETAVRERPGTDDGGWLGWLVDRIVTHTTSLTDDDPDPGDPISDRQRAAAVETLTGLVTDATVVLDATGDVSTVAGAVGPLAADDPALFTAVVSEVGQRVAAGEVTPGVDLADADPSAAADAFRLAVYPDGIACAASGDHPPAAVADLLDAGVAAVDADDKGSLLARTLSRLFGTDDAGPVEAAAVERLTDPAGALYDQGLAYAADGAFEDAAGAFGTMWDHRPPEGHLDRTDADAAGVLSVAARTAAGQNLDAGDVLAAVDPGALPDPVAAVLDAVDDENRSVDFDPDLPSDAEDSPGSERRACAALLDALGAGGHAGPPDDEADGASLPPGRTARAAYHEALSAWRSGEPRDAFRTARRRCRDVWQQRGRPGTDGDVAYRAGVVWTAHLAVLAASDRAAGADLEAVVTELSVETARLSTPTAALLHWVQTGEYGPTRPSVTSPDDGVPPTAETRPENDLAAAERAAIERFLRAVQGVDTVHVESRSGEGGPDSPAGSVDDDTATDDVVADYAEGLTLVADGEVVPAVDPLLEAWDARDDVPDEQEPYALAAGVAVAVLVRDDPVLSLADSQVVSTVGPRVEDLPPAAGLLFEALRDSPDRTAASEVREAADSLPGGVEAPVGEAFATLLLSLSE